MRDAPRDDPRPPKPAPVKYVPKKWKELTATQYSKLTAVEKSRYDAVSKQYTDITATYARNVIIII